MKYFPCGPLGLSSVIVLLLFEARALVDRWRSGKEMLGISAASLWHPCGISEASPASRPSAPTALIPNEPAVAGFVSGILGISKCWAWILGISGIPSLFVAPMKADLGLPHSKWVGLYWFGFRRFLASPSVGRGFLESLESLASDEGESRLLSFKTTRVLSVWFLGFLASLRVMHGFLESLESLACSLIQWRPTSASLIQNESGFGGLVYWMLGTSKSCARILCISGIPSMLVRWRQISASLIQKESVRCLGFLASPSVGHGFSASLESLAFLCSDIVSFEFSSGFHCWSLRILYTLILDDFIFLMPSFFAVRFQFLICTFLFSLY